MSAFGQNRHFLLFLLKFAQKIFFGGRNFKTLSPDLELAPSRYHVYKFSVKMDQVEFCGLSLEKLPNCIQFLILITLRMLERAEWRLK